MGKNRDKTIYRCHEQVKAIYWELTRMEKVDGSIDVETERQRGKNGFNMTSRYHRCWGNSSAVLVKILWISINQNY